METELSFQDKKRIEESIRQKYNKVATNPNGLFEYPTGRKGLAALNYSAGLIRELSDAVADSYCGVGNPFTLGPIREGDAVLDIGCGAGVDTILAGKMVGPLGKAVGVDMVPEMVERAKENLGMTDLENVAFMKASAEELPFANDDFDVVISNGVFNLIPDKLKALAEVCRVLKPGGRLMVADQVLAGDPTDDMKARIDSWFR